MPGRGLDLEGMTAIVTGGGTGLGRAMALALAEAGASIVLAARRRQPLEETAAEIEKLGAKTLVVPTDVTRSEQVNAMVSLAIQEMGKVDILVNNAGVVREEVRKPLWEITDEEWRRGIDTNLTGTFYCCRAVGRHMVDRNYGRIVNISSGFGIRGLRDNFMYCAAKAGVILLTKSLALTWGGYNIRVNCVAPGLFRTFRPREFYDARAPLIPMGRVGLPEEIGPLVVFLSSPACDYINGEVFCADGGALAGGYAPVSYAPAVPLEEAEDAGEV